MGFFNNFFSVLLLLFSAYSCYHLVRNRPDLFSGENLSRSFTTMGLLALSLAGFVALLFYSLPTNPNGQEPHRAGSSVNSRVMSDRSL